NHIARTSFYKETIFVPEFGFKRGDFIEDTLGQTMHAEIRGSGIEAWKKWGMFLYYPEDGELVVLVHVNGRMYCSEEKKVELEKRGRGQIEE
ncbi:hypothetical protein HDU98_006828, partial [Podochytrium sp. JEL0797]